MQGADEKGIDYDKLIQKFGSQKISDELLERFTKVSNFFKFKPPRFCGSGWLNLY